MRGLISQKWLMLVVVMLIILAVVYRTTFGRKYILGMAS